MGNLSGFYSNYGNIKEGGGGGSLPQGDYNVGIESATVKPTKNDPNQGYLELKLKVMDGDFAGRYAPDMRLNLWNASEKAREIANETLKSITMATGVGPIDDSSQLVGKTMQVTVRPQKDNPQYSESVNPTSINRPAFQQQNPQGGGGFNPDGGAFGQQQNPQQGAAPAFLPSTAPAQQEPAYTPTFRP